MCNLQCDMLAPWRRPYATSDGYICMLAYTDIQWRRFWHEVERPELGEDPRFATLADRSDNIEELYRIVGECVAGGTTAGWIDTLARLEIPAAPVSTLEELQSDPHLRKVGFFRKAEHPTEGSIVMPDIPVRFSRTEADITRLQPKLGEHSIEILREAGLGDGEIERLINDRATRDGSITRQTPNDRDRDA